MSRNNNRFSEINGYDIGSRYSRRHPEREENRSIPGTLTKQNSRIFQVQQCNKKPK